MHAWIHILSRVWLSVGVSLGIPFINREMWFDCICMLTQAVYHTLSCFQIISKSNHSTNNSGLINTITKTLSCWVVVQAYVLVTFQLWTCHYCCWYSNDRCRYGTAFDLSQTFPLSSEQKLGSVLWLGTKLLLPVLGLPYKQSWDSCWDG